MRGASGLMGAISSLSRRFSSRNTTSGSLRFSVLPFVLVLLAALIFAADTFTSLEIAAAVFYVVVVLLSATFLGSRGVAAVSIVCMALTVVSFFLTPLGDEQAGMVNTFISLVAIGSTMFLAIRSKSAQTAADEARSQLAHISRVTTLGELAGSIAHEVNQPLGAISVNGNTALRWLLADPPNMPEAIKTLRFIVEDANRASQIIARLRRLSRKAPVAAVPVDINEAIREISSLMQHEFRRHRIALLLLLSDGLPPVAADRVQLQQVIMNLLNNALEAVTGGKESPNGVTITTELETAKFIGVSVSDTGSGIEAGVAERMFDAFYTTKPSGMGVGLAISRSIVEAHGGRFRVKRNNPRGTVMQFTLPISRKTRPQ